MMLCCVWAASMQGQDSTAQWSTIQDTAQQHWAIAVPQFRNLALNAHEERELHPVGAPFYMGFRAALDSLNHSQDSLRVALSVFDRSSGHYTHFAPKDYPVDSTELPYYIHSLTPEVFNRMLELNRVDYLIGPLRQQAVQELAKLDGNYQIINPLSSYPLTLDSSNQVISLSPESTSEMSSLGEFVAQATHGLRDTTDSLGMAFEMPQHIVFLLPSEQSTKFNQRLEAFQMSYKLAEGDTTMWTFVDMSKPGWDLWPIWSDSSDVTIYADLEQIDMFQFYNVIRQRDANHTYMIYGAQTINQTIQMPSVVLRFPFVWSQSFQYVANPELSDDLNFLWDYLHLPPNRWAWLGYDAAMTTWELAWSDSIAPVNGPRRLLLPELNEGGFRSRGIFRYLYIPGKGFFDGHLQSLNNSNHE